ncbi:hypothetical protein EPN44_12635 [bacterium]|nr:MAG: hypothetical protein EPN44_12635 [bacterium]
MTALIILNDPPYGTERSYNGLRHAGSLARASEQSVLVFLIGDAAACAKKGQRVPSGRRSRSRWASPYRRRAFSLTAKRRSSRERARASGRRSSPSTSPPARMH